jgi:uncharacterized cupin superfamily protein
MLVHWDDIAWETVAVGELRWSRQRLAPGLSRFRAEPGDRIMPAHVHVDEEELVVVLSGTGYSWQDGTAYPIRAREVVVHRPDAEAHTLIAGDDGLEVLIFASGSTTGLTRLPRAGVIRVGNGVWPLDADPFAAEPPLEAFTPCAQRPETIVALDELPGEHHGQGRFGVLERCVAGALSGLCLVELAEDRVSWPAHFHSLADEKFVVLEGEGEARIGGERHPLRPGSIVHRPPSSRVEHALHGGPMTYLAWGTNPVGDAIFYPDTGKLRAGGALFRVEPVDYWDGDA